MDQSDLPTATDQPTLFDNIQTFFEDNLQTTTTDPPRPAPSSRGPQTSPDIFSTDRRRRPFSSRSRARQPIDRTPDVAEPATTTSRRRRPEPAAVSREQPRRLTGFREQPRRQEDAFRPNSVVAAADFEDESDVTRPEEALFNLVQESLEDQSSGSFGQPTLPATSRQNDKFIPSRSTDTFAAFRNPSTQPPTANRRPPLAAPFSRKPAAKPFSNVESLALATLVEPEDAVNPDLEYEYYYDYLDTPDTAHKADYDLVPLANKVINSNSLSLSF